MRQGRDTPSKQPEQHVENRIDEQVYEQVVASKLRALFLRHQDRILFGTDLGVGQRSLMLGSSGADEPTAADVKRFFSATWRFFETDDKSFPHPTPIQGRWKISGIKLPPKVLRKIYHQNAKRLFKLRVK